MKVCIYKHISFVKIYIMIPISKKHYIIYNAVQYTYLQIPFSLWEENTLWNPFHPLMQGIHEARHDKIGSVHEIMIIIDWLNPLLCSRGGGGRWGLQDYVPHHTWWEQSFTKSTKSWWEQKQSKNFKTMMGSSDNGKGLHSLNQK